MTLFALGAGALIGGLCAWCVGFLNRARDVRLGRRREIELPNGGLLVVSRGVDDAEADQIRREWIERNA